MLVFCCLTTLDNGTAWDADNSGVKSISNSPNSVKAPAAPNGGLAIFRTEGPNFYNSSWRWPAIQHCHTPHPHFHIFIVVEHRLTLNIYKNIYFTLSKDCLLLLIIILLFFSLFFSSFTKIFSYFHLFSSIFHCLFFLLSFLFFLFLFFSFTTDYKAIFSH